MGTLLSSPHFRAGLIQGLLALSALTVILLIWSVLKSESTLNDLKERLPVQRVILSIPEPSEEAVTPLEPNQINETIIVEPVIAQAPQTEEPLSSPEQQQASGMKQPLLVDGLYEESPFGPLPRRRITDGAAPFEIYSKQNTLSGSALPIAVIIQDMGLSSAHSSEVMKELPADVTLAFSPYAVNPEPLLQAARDAGHEYWLTLPLETRDPTTQDTGPLAVRADFSLDDNRQILHQVMGSMPGYAGLIAPDANNTLVSFGKASVERTLSEIFDRGLALAYGGKVRNERLDDLAMRSNGWSMPISFIRTEPFVELQDDLEQRLLQRQPIAILIRAHPEQLDEIRVWVANLENRGYQLVPLSKLFEINE